MLARALTHALVGLEPRRVDVEVHLQGGLPSFAIVGLVDRAVQEAKHRIRSGVASAELEWPKHRITVNLAPAQLRKEGSAFDLPIALAILAASGQFPRERLLEHAAVGELGLDGRLLRVGGVLAVAEGATRAAVDRLICPADSAAEAAPAGVEPGPVRHRAEAVAYLRGELELRWEGSANGIGAEPHVPDLADVRGHERARRALEIAAAGRHNLLLAGPPGTGKTMLAQRLPGILPPLDERTALTVTALHGLTGHGAAAVQRHPPFRAPHHTVSRPGLIGGGVPLQPGEVSLAHAGALFLDELPEWSRLLLETLRQPLEERCVRLARAGHTVTFPARFQLVAAMNPCPCGLLGHPRQGRRCTPHQIAMYRQRISGPLLDRFDLFVEVPVPPARDLLAPARDEGSAGVAARVAAARAVPRARRELPADPAVRARLEDAITRYGLSGR